MARYRGITWEYLVGFTDGDGCIYIKPTARKGQPSQIKLTWYQHEKDAAVLREIRHFLKGHGINVIWNQRKNENTNCKPTGELVSMWVSGMAVTQLALMNLEPFLITKRMKAREALKIMSNGPGKRGRPKKTRERVI